MKRLLLAGVSLTVTACSMSPSPSSTASSSISRPNSSQYLLSLAATPDCTLWRDTGGTRVCLDSATTEAPALAVAPQSPKAPRLARAVGQDSRDFVMPAPVAAPAASQPAAPKVQAVAPVPVAKPAEPQMPAVAAFLPKRETTVFAEMQRIGMLDAQMKVVGAPPRIVVAQAQPALSGLPQLPTQALATPPVAAPADLPQLPKAALGVIAQAPASAQPVAQAFAAEPVAAPQKQAPAAPVYSAQQSWQPVAEPVQLAQAKPDTVSRAPVAPVERAELPAVRGNAVVPLKITEKAADGRPATVTPAAQPSPAAVAANPGAMPDLPPLPQLPGASAPQPIVPAVAVAPPPPAAQPVRPVLPPAPQPAMQPMAAQPKPVVQPVAAPAAPAAKPVAKAAAKPAVKPAQTGKLNGVAPSAAPATAGGQRYLVIHSFTDQLKAQQTAQKYGHLGATVATAQIKGQTWYRVVVRDGAAQREKLVADGVRTYWPVSL
jgi:hypothetical protein